MANNFNSTYRIIDKLRRSDSNEKADQHSRTYLISNQNEQNEANYILRLINLENLTNLSEFITDISWYKQFNHFNLMSLKDCFLIDTKLNLVKPYASFGSCADLLNSNPFGVCERLIAHIIWQTLQAIRYLQDRHILHRGIASKNIYVCDDGRVLLDEFSHCISMISPFDGKLRKQIFDYTDKLKDQLLYLAPEIIYQNSDGYNLKSDVYSLGMVACELANGSNSYRNMTYGNLNILYAKIQGSEPILLDGTQLTDEMIGLCDSSNSSYIEEIKKRKYTKEFHSFIKSCVSTCLESRCSLDELQSHAFFKFQKRLSRDRNSLHCDMVSLLETYKKKRPINKEINHLEETSCNFPTNDYNEKRNLTWEF
ncbi:unnamed protein product [Rotaria socialis]|uniref:Protein kinase domain-containing protein n=1 Tax=Rotaria socialis TaxID=392032 RepID=A0A817WA25_9BILA|nr:unnamed protein product [Rotaria socialis]CAF3353099.1 unnamed protein product [Rotaria socialis]CAF3415722.1 unnamed protein product [Rotaria socialis]CAF3469587.1 unnamed protein product [Rotaria socialis]CAF3767090.1 unnamed protein product [Rotaria socialis]